MILVLLLAALTAADPPASAPVEDPRAVLRRALFDFSQGEYALVVRQLEPLVDPPRLTEEEDLVLARKALGTVYFLVDDKLRAREQFELLLFLDPDAVLDPYSTAPPVMRFFGEVKATAARNARESRRIHLERRRLFEAPRLFERTTIKLNPLLCFLPFGVGQFQNDDLGYGLMFLAIDVLALAANVVGYVFGQLLADPQGQIKARDAGKRTAWMVVQYAGLAGFVAGWTAGAVHARLRFRPFVALERELPRASLAPPAFGVSLTSRF